jgi:hypothetical protein
MAEVFEEQNDEEPRVVVKLIGFPEDHICCYFELPTYLPTYLYLIITQSRSSLEVPRHSWLILQS